MVFIASLFVLQLVMVHTVDGRMVGVNPFQVTHLSEARRDIDDTKQLAPGVRCVIFFSDASYVSTAEECVEVVNKWVGMRQ